MSWTLLFKSIIVYRNPEGKEGILRQINPMWTSVLFLKNRLQKYQLPGPVPRVITSGYQKRKRIDFSAQVRAESDMQAHWRKKQKWGTVNFLSEFSTPYKSYFGKPIHGKNGKHCSKWSWVHWFCDLQYSTELKIQLAKP